MRFLKLIFYLLFRLADIECQDLDDVEELVLCQILPILSQPASE